MKENINPIANQVLNGRRRMTRQMVLTSVASIPAVVYAKSILPNGDGSDRMEGSWGGLGVMTEDDENAVDYQHKGYAMVLMDQFTGAALNKGLIAVDGAEASFMAQIEPFDHDIDLFKQYENQTGWTPEGGDVFCLLISTDYVLWVENVGQQGQTLVNDFGAKYLLNKRDDLAYLDIFKDRPAVP